MVLSPTQRRSVAEAIGERPFNRSFRNGARATAAIFPV
jgi:hypothetical protein